MYSIIDVLILPDILNLNIGFEIILYYGILIISAMLFIISIISAINQNKKINTTEKTLKHYIVYILLILLPIFMFCISYFKEMNYINNSKLILICSSGEEFSEENYGYAISNKYSKLITIGTDFRGIAMKKYLPGSFYELNYTWSTDKIEMNDNNITIYRDNEIIFKIDIANKVSHCDIEEVFYKK